MTFKGEERRRVRPSEAARSGIARTFQNIALFKGMSTLDNIMTGRNTKMTKNIIWQALYYGPRAARKKNIALTSRKSSTS